MIVTIIVALIVAVAPSDASAQSIKSGDKLLTGLGITKIDTMFDGTFVIYSKLDRFKEMHIQQLLLNRNRIKSLIVIEVDQARMFGFLPAAGNNDSTAIFFSANDYGDYMSKKGSYLERPDKQAYCYASFLPREDDAMAYSLERILSRISKKDLPLILEPDMGVDRYQVECGGRNYDVLVHICRYEAIRICLSGGGNPYNISTSVEPDGEGGYCATTTYDCSRSQ